MGRNADDFILAQQLTRLCRIGIILTQMHTVRIHRKCYFNRIVDDERHTEAAAQLLNLPRLLQKLLRSQALLPKLNQGHTALERLFHLFI